MGVLLVGLGAVSSTLIAGVEHVRRGMGQPIGSITQMGTVRVGKRTDGTSPAVKELVPLAELDQLVFGAWDPISDNAYEAALKAGVLNQHEDIEPIADFLKSIEPMPAAFDNDYVKRISGDNVKTVRQQARPRRGYPRRRPQLQEGQPLRPPRHDLRRLHREVHHRV